jgi:hypothetical protein
MAACGQDARQALRDDRVWTTNRQRSTKAPYRMQYVSGRHGAGGDNEEMLT